MPRTAIRKRSAAVDMTAGAVLSFLLLPFFMVTGKFRPHWPVSIQLPVSHTPWHCTLWDGVTATLVMNKEGRAFLSVDSPGRWVPLSDHTLDDVKADRWYLIADKNTPYEKIDQLFSLLKENDIRRIKLVTE